MALLAEEIVEEWLNRQGYFTIRGIKIGVHEIDLLAVKLGNKSIDCKHIEVTASMRPMSYITDVPKAIQKETRRPAKSPVHRTTEELLVGIQEWIDKKFNLESKKLLRQELYPDNWAFELVVHKVRHPEELELIQNAGIKVYLLKDILRELATTEMTIKKAAGSSLIDLSLILNEETKNK
jgi:hypothetical protein